MATKTQDIFHKFKKFPGRQQADGTDIQVEVREDEEQGIKLQEIIDLLVAAGYFRARIKGLSPFDKVVGGMTWAIQSCNIDVDVDLLFQENSTIGQKISLTEKIVAVLPKMKCPHRIEPHQIQGLDFIHIFPVIQWLVKRSMEFRQEMSQFVRSYAVMEFHKQFPSKNQIADVQKKVLQNISSISEAYRPHRYFKRKGTPPEDIRTRVQITLLEYGLRGDIRNTIQNQTSEEEALEEQQANEQQIQNLLNSMAISKDDNLQYDVLNEDEKRQLEKHYEILKSELEDGGLKSKDEKVIAKLDGHIKVLEDKCGKLENEITDMNAKIEISHEKINGYQNECRGAEAKLQELEELISTNPEKAKETEELVILYDKFKTQETEFKEQCKQELSKLQSKLEEAKKASTPVEEVAESKEEVEKEYETMRVLRLQIAKHNRKIIALQRKVAEVPSRAELAQYQRRFLELYNQMAAKHQETKQYYTLYNTLEDTRMYMTKQLSLLNSISDNYQEAMSSSSSKEEFLAQMVSILESVQHSKTKLDNKLAGKREERDKISESLQVLIEQQRKYVLAVRQLSIECKKYENLVASQKS